MLLLYNLFQAAIFAKYVVFGVVYDILCAGVLIEALTFMLMSPLRAWRCKISVPACWVMHLHMRFPFCTTTT